jgi:hypothetical protein
MSSAKAVTCRAHGPLWISATSPAACAAIADRSQHAMMELNVLGMIFARLRTRRSVGAILWKRGGEGR